MQIEKSKMNYNIGDRVRVCFTKELVYPIRDKEGTITRCGKAPGYYWVKMDGLPELIFKVETLKKI